MSERFRYRPPEERESRPLPKTHDFRYAYRGYYDAGASAGCGSSRRRRCRR